MANEREKETADGECMENMQTENTDIMETAEASSARETAENGSVCPGCKKTERSEEQKKKLINRLSRIEGQIRGIRGMVERDAYCNDILMQSAAVSAAVSSFNRELLSAHIHTCVVRDIRDGKDEVVDELVATIYKLMR